jgi:hypothetical protein
MSNPQLELGIRTVGANPEPNESDDELLGLDELLHLNRQVADGLSLVCPPSLDILPLTGALSGDRLGGTNSTSGATSSDTASKSSRDAAS